MIDWQLDYTRGGAFAGDDCSLERERLAQLLAAFQVYLGHDLPNHLVAAQGMARLLGEVAGDRLGGDERALLDRLAALARQADARARRLAEVGRLLRGPARGAPVALGEVAAEAAAAVAASGDFPTVRVTCRVEEVQTTASRELLQRALVELIRNAAGEAARAGGGEVLVEGGAAPGGVVVRALDGGGGPGGRPAALAPLGQAEAGSAAGLGLLLVHQAVARWRGRFALGAAGGGCAATLFVPEGAPGHGGTK